MCWKPRGSSTKYQPEKPKMTILKRGKLAGGLVGISSKPIGLTFGEK
jgi:hypothetical protein